MTADRLVALLREGLWLALLVAAPPLVAALGAGVVVSLLQQATRIEERGVTWAAKLVAGLVALALAGPWIGAHLLHFTGAVLALLPTVR